MKNILTLLLIFLLFLTVRTFAFDGKRKGLILGGGLGFISVAHWKAECLGLDYHENKISWGENIIIGYGWSEHNMLVLELNIASYTSKVLDLAMVQGFVGPSWYHYFRTQGRSLFMVLGIGMYRFVRRSGIYVSFDYNPRVSPPQPFGCSGVGYLIGCGYEFARHLRITAYVSGGHTSEDEKNYGNRHVNILLNAVAF